MSMITSPPWTRINSTTYPSAVVGSAVNVSALLKGYTRTHHEHTTNDYITATETFIGDACMTMCQHLNAFATPSVELQVLQSDSINWSALDAMFGYPTQSSGAFSHLPANQLGIKVFGCPKWMRYDGATGGAFTDGPINDPANAGFNSWPLGVSDVNDAQCFPHYSHFQDFANLVALAAVRYPHVRFWEMWNEWKGGYVGSEGRWYYEGATRLFNLVYTALKATTSTRVAAGGTEPLTIAPYMVFKKLSWSLKSSWDTAVYPWGRFDKTVLEAYQYWNTHSNGADYIGLDTRGNASDYERADHELSAKVSFTSGNRVLTLVDGPYTTLPQEFGKAGVMTNGCMIEGTGIPAGATVSSFTATTVTVDAGHAPTTNSAVGGTLIRYAPALTKVLTDGVITGANTLTSASAPFTSAYSGTRVVGPGIPMGTTITYVSTTVVTLNPPSGTTVINGAGPLRVSFGTWPHETAYYWPVGMDAWNSERGLSDTIAWCRNQGGLLLSKPIWLSERYANPPQELDLYGTGETVSSDQIMLSVEVWHWITELLEGVAGSLHWRPQSEGATTSANPLALWKESDHTATVLYAPMKFVKDHFSAGVQLYPVASANANVRGIASATHMIIVSKLDSSFTMTIDGDTVVLDPYDVKLIVR